MAFLKIENVSVKGVTVCIPKNIEENMEYETVPLEQRKNFVEAIGIERRHVADLSTCASDLCYKSAEHLIAQLGWEKDSIDLVIFVSQTPDYKMPATSCLLQERLGLQKTTMTIDISQGCSGYVYGLGVAGSLVSSGTIKRCLLLVGNTQTKNLNYKDKSTYPLFSDAGSATAIEYNPVKGDTFYLSYGSDGGGENTIIIPDGGYRNMVNEDSFVEETLESGITRCRLNVYMKGDEVFTFVVGNIPKFAKELFNHFDLKNEQIDYYFLHHASWLVLKKLIKKLAIPDGKAPILLREYGNISNVSIPLLLTHIGKELTSSKLNLFITGFGVGLSLGVGVIEVGPLSCADLIEY